MPSRFSYNPRYCFVLAACVVCGAGCIDTASSNNDNTQSAAGTGVTAGSGGAGAGAGGMSAAAGSGGSTATAGRGAAGRGGSTGSGTAGVVADEDGGVTEPPAPDSGTSSEGAAGEGTAGEPAPGEGAAGSTSEPPPVTAPDPSLVAGTATASMCHSYSPVMNGMCAGWFCGVNQETLGRALDPAAKCGGNLEILCRGDVPTATGNCARMLKQSMAAASDEQLRPLIEQCVYENAELKEKVPADCLSCMIDVAQCAGQVDTCLFACLSGDSPECDTCRLENNCDQMVFSCGGLPNPF